jgi:ligand-binding sensor domain-containing protein/serine phosphatase RsbU (regulator of sigma subunit)
MFRLLFFLTLCLVFNGFSQTFNFNQFSTKNGLSQDFIYTINQDNNGYLWIGTGEGLNQFDGKKINVFNQKNGLQEDIIISSFKDSSGVIWFGHNNGTLTKLTGESFEKIPPNKNIISPINKIETFENNVYFITQNSGLFVYKNDEIKQLGKFNQDLFYTFKIINENTILLGTNSGLLVLKNSNGKWKSEQEISDIEVTSILITKDNKIIIGTSDGKLLFVKILTNKIKSNPLVNNLNISYPIKEIIEDDGNDLWISTAGEGVLKINDYQDNQPSIDYYNETNGLPSDYIQTIFQDREGNIWIGTFGSGLFSLTNRNFLFYNQLKRKDVKAIQVYKNTKWFGTNNGLIEILPNDSVNIYDSNHKFIDDEISDLQLFDSILWIGTYSNGIYNYDLSTQKFNKIKWDFGSTQNRINNIIVEKNRMWIATNGGLIIYDKNANSTTILTTEDGLDHNAIESIYKAKDGRLFLGTYSRNLFVIDNSSIQEIEIIESGELNILDFSETSNGDLWIATAENGVFKMSQDSIFSYSSLNGLLSNYCYAIEADGNDKIWVGHRNGLSRIDPEKNNEISIYKADEGIKGQVNNGAMFLDQKDLLWIGTDEGVIKFDSKNEILTQTQPIANLTNITINDEEYPIKSPIKLKYNTYRIKFDYIGISLKEPDNIYYQTMLEGYDENFSKPTQDPFTTYSKIQDGEYIFRVRTFLGANNDLSNETSIKIVISKPYWKQWWFFVLSIILISGIIYSFFWFKIQRLKKQKEIIQNELDIKTKQVVDSAKKIEIINKDLMSSINYALKLQKAILPPQRNLSNIFPESFIYFKPRNVVSGDFYFLNQCNNKVIFACVDCTGHGVPGAFMSLIGYVALRDIYKMNEVQQKWQTPDQILESLDVEIKTLLETHSVDKNTNNGMDMIICEYNTETHELLIASAKRPIVIYNDGELKVIKGEKRSIGEQDFGLILPFQLHRFSIKPGDGIYLFSDGFTDQFGGKKTKKFGIKQTINIINELKKSEPKQQKKYIIETFEEWKADTDQTDDIIFMGVYF